MSPRSYPFKRPDGAEKRKGYLLMDTLSLCCGGFLFYSFTKFLFYFQIQSGWLDDEGQPIREISSVMMTTSGYLSSSREGKLPETKIRKVFLEAEVDSFSGIEKKVNMKKVFEGIKKPDDSSKKSDEKEDQLKKLNDPQKDREVVSVEEKRLLQEHTKGGDGEKEGKKLKEKEREKEKEVEKDKLVEKEREKEKIKKKRNKEKLLEEFNFFEKEKSVSFKPPELSVPVDTTKQKLNIFKKLPKTRDTIDGQLSRGLVTRVTSDIGEISDKVPGVISDGCGIKSLSETPLPSVNSEALVEEKVRTSKKERKLKNKRDRHDFPSTLDEPVEVQHKRKPGKEVFTGEVVCSIEESLEVSEPTSFGRTSLNKSKTTVADQPKKKRGRPSRVITPESESNEPQNSEVVPATQPQSFIPSLPKPFFPFPPHFAVPGLIPPPFIPNVPFNLLGVPPLGLRSPLGISSTNMSTNAGPIVTNASPPPGFYTPPKADSINKVPPLSSPNTKSPNIVDSLPESTDMSLNVTNCEDDSNVMKKKEKRDKKDKEKKKKEKKVKEKISDEHERKIKREKKKEKKDKEKDKEKTKEKEETITVPKITFKFAAAPTSPAQPATPDPTPKMYRFFFSTFLRLFTFTLAYFLK